MRKFFALPGIFCKSSGFINLFTMSKSGESVYYAVGRGRQTGIYNSWKDCKSQVEGVANAKYRKFFSLEAAEEFVDFWKNYESPTRERSKSPVSVSTINTETEQNEYLAKEIKEDAKSYNEHESPCVETKPPATPQRLQEYRQPSESPSSHHSLSLDQKNVDVLALNLRLDSFEKRFDTCLKEVGGIFAEIKNIKTEISQIKEAITLTSGGSRYSPAKKKSGFLQTTLNFGSNSSSSRSYSTSKDEEGSEEENASKRLKRKLSRSDSKEANRKRSHGEDTDDIASRIKTDGISLSSFTKDFDDYVEVYTDGACHSNGQNDAKAGIGIWFGNDHPMNVGEPVHGAPTNNTAEIQAARVAIELAARVGVSKLKIYTDSEFLLNCVTKWMHRWKKNGWTLVNGGQVKNKKELEKLDKAASKLKIVWEKVEAHAGIHGNEMADRLANEGASRYRR